ncbi:MAG TPA: rRNA maturation RNase YbeY [Stellaceae bacterium]|nr:rRNA maturation RNase YbeY [Stellaceae bacterium]
MSSKAIDRSTTIDIAEPCAAWREALPRRRALCRAAARAALAAAPSGWVAPETGAELSIVLGDDALLRRLNRQWRGKDKPTNVLAFPADEGATRGAPSPGAAPLLLGDVVLAFGTVAGEAAAQGKTLAGHLAHLVVHGVLHLLGFDHEEAAAALRMEALETTVLAGIGIADPYRTSAPPLRVRHG